MSKKSELEEILENEARAIRYWENALIADITDEIEMALEDRGWSHKDLAERLGVTPGHVSRLLSGQRNMTMKTLARIGYVLGVHPRLRLRDERPAVRLGEGGSIWTGGSMGRVVLLEHSMRKLDIESSNTDWSDPYEEVA